MKSNKGINMTKIKKIIAKCRLSKTESYLIVFINGIFAKELSSPLEGLQDKVSGKSIADKNGAGAYLDIKENTIIPEPIHLLFLTSGNGKEIFISNKITLGANSNINIIEEYLALNEINEDEAIICCSNITTQIHTEKNSQINYCKILNAKQTKHNSELKLIPGEASSVTTHHLIFGDDSNENKNFIGQGKAEIKENINITLTAPNAICHHKGLYKLGDQQNLDLNIVTEHIAPDCQSKILFKGIADHEAKATFAGKIIIRSNAKRTAARLDNKNLLLNQNAHIITSPALEIYADDVECSHGATVGQLDENALWYLQTRGIMEEDARKILIDAFVREILGSLPKFLEKKIDSLNN